MAAELERISADARATRCRRAGADRARRARTRSGYALTAGGRRVGSIHLEAIRDRRGAAARRRLLPALASLLGVAIDRERLAARGARGRGAAAERRDEDGRPACGEPRPADAADGDLDLGGRARARATSSSTTADRARAARDDPRRVRPPRPPGRQPARPLAAPGGRGAPGAGASGRSRTSSIGALDELGATPDASRSRSRTDSPAVRVDAHQIERVLVNLIENALKYSPRGGADPRAGAPRRAAEALVRVIDHGPGVARGGARADLRAVPARAATSGGVAAPASASRSRAGFAEANGGRVWVESRAGQGATFVLALRRAPEPRAPVA